MEQTNSTNVSEFILWWPAHLLQYHNILFGVALPAYIMSIIGNGLIITLVCLETKLQTPMYFFLCNLSFLDMCFTSVTMPTILEVFLVKKKCVSMTNCITQSHFLHFLGGTECFLLATMAYDRYVAICKPLHYGTLMNSKVCKRFGIFYWTCGFIDSLTLSILTSKLSFCGPHHIDNLFCDFPPLIKLACTDTAIIELVVRITGGIVVLMPFLFILWSYFNILGVIWGIPSIQGKRKAFSTCSSHIVVVGLFYGTASYIYIRPSPNISSDKDRLIVLVYTVLTPTLNPMIYSLRNNDMKGALKKVLQKTISW